MREAAEWMDRYRKFWTKQLGGLAEFLENAGGASPSKRPRKSTEKDA